MHESRVRAVRVVLALVCVVACAAPVFPASGLSAAAGAALGSTEVLAPVLSERGRWVWPLDGRRVVARAFLAPPHAYGPGHRGVDLRADELSGDESSGIRVFAPADGIVAFVGTVADRPLLTIDHGNGLVSTLEPVTAELTPGQSLAQGDTVGLLADGGHAAPGTLHFGARLDGQYVNPLLLLGGVSRARLLPLGPD